MVRTISILYEILSYCVKYFRDYHLIWRSQTIVICTTYLYTIVIYPARTRLYVIRKSTGYCLKN